MRIVVLDFRVIRGISERPCNSTHSFFFNLNFQTVKLNKYIDSPSKRKTMGNRNMQNRKYKILHLQTLYFRTFRTKSVTWVPLKKIMYVSIYLKNNMSL